MSGGSTAEFISGQGIANHRLPTRRRTAPPEPDLLRNADRTEVRRIDIGDDLRKTQPDEPVPDQHGRRLGGISPTPRRWPKPPADLHLRALGIHGDEQHPTEKDIFSGTRAYRPIAQAARIGATRTLLDKGAMGGRIEIALKKLF